MSETPDQRLDRLISEHLDFDAMSPEQQRIHDKEVTKAAKDIIKSLKGNRS
jgi:hypothetical protein